MPNATSCKLCGLIVGDHVLHAEWHRKLDRVAEVADAYHAPDGSGLSEAMSRWSVKRALAKKLAERNCQGA